MTSGLTARRARALRALCDTYVPAVVPPAVEADDPTGFWRRTASDLGTDEAVGRYLLDELEPTDRDGMLKLLDLLGVAGFPVLPQGARESLIAALRRASADLADGLDAYRILTLIEHYGRPVDGRANPNWEQFGYPGPP